MCGENKTPVSVAKSAKGSPPRVRGKPDLLHHFLRFRRITPACAGKTQRNHTAAARRQDHPRACGENSQEQAKRCVEKGSPPRMRGKHVEAGFWRECNRITPAHAGKTRTTGKVTAVIKDHPRACGENGAICANRIQYKGSPPRMRGKLPSSNSQFLS